MASNGRTIVGGLVGGLMMEAYSLFAWVVLPYNRAFFESIPVSEGLQRLFFEHAPDLHDGMWVFGKPGSTDPGGVVFLFLNGLPSPAWDLAGGAVISLLTGLAVSWIYATTASIWAPAPRKGILFVMLLGAVAAIPAQFHLAITVGQPIPFSLAMAADTVIEFLLLGIVLAVVHRPRATARS
ncbi:MAG TPA: hypothetical protein VFN94_02660 [Nitrospiria bacterium]|nr:hypothetical protein [Nitrospiria bacterium]